MTRLYTLVLWHSPALPEYRDHRTEPDKIVDLARAWADEHPGHPIFVMCNGFKIAEYMTPRKRS